MVRILDKKGLPLAPTTRYGRVRRLLKSGQAIVVHWNPFTIQLQYDVVNAVRQTSE